MGTLLSLRAGRCYFRALRKMALLRFRMLCLKIAIGQVPDVSIELAECLTTAEDTLKLTVTRAMSISCPTLLKHNMMTPGDVEYEVDQFTARFEDMTAELWADVYRLEAAMEQLFKGVVLTFSVK